MEDTNSKIIRGNDNVFEDLGFEKEEATNLRIRADLMLDLKSHIQHQGWSYDETTHYLNTSQATLDNLNNGEISKFTVDSLIHLLGKAGMTVEVKVLSKIV